MTSVPRLPDLLHFSLPQGDAEGAMGMGGQNQGGGQGGQARPVMLSAHLQAATSRSMMLPAKEVCIT